MITRHNTVHAYKCVDMCVTYSFGVAEVGFWLGVWFELLLLVTHIHPAVFHDLLCARGRGGGESACSDIKTDKTRGNLAHLNVRRVTEPSLSLISGPDLSSCGDSDCTVYRDSKKGLHLQTATFAWVQHQQSLQ